MKMWGSNPGTFKSYDAAFQTALGYSIEDSEKYTVVKKDIKVDNEKTVTYYKPCMKSDLGMARDDGYTEVRKHPELKNLNEKQIRMFNMVKEYIEYVVTYVRQQGYTDFSDNIFIDDMIYGIGVVVNRDEYSYSNGYDKFKTFLIDNIIKRSKE
jgi:hypothetical protein